jgi:hypothetical protein
MFSFVFSAQVGAHVASSNCAFLSFTSGGSYGEHAAFIPPQPFWEMAFIPFFDGLHFVSCWALVFDSAGYSGIWRAWH